jgi:hypothetical protein
VGPTCQPSSLSLISPPSYLSSPIPLLSPCAGPRPPSAAELELARPAVLTRGEAAARPAGGAGPRRSCSSRARRRWPVVELELARPVARGGAAARVPGSAGPWQSSSSPGETAGARKREKGGDRRKKERSDRWAHRHVESTSPKPPSKTLRWPNMNGFESWVAKDS